MEQEGSASAPAAAVPDNRSPLSIPTFRNLWTANAVSNFGTQVQVVAATWLMATLTPSPQLVALVQAATGLPIMVLALLGGAMADNMDRRRLMLFSQWFMLATAISLAGLTWLGLMVPWLLLFFTFLISAGGALNNPSWQASVRDIVPRTAISRAVALNSASFNLARTLGPALGGVIVGFGSPPVAFLVNAASFLGIIAALRLWRPAPRPLIAPKERLMRAMGAGVRYAALSPHIRAILLRSAISGFSASAAFALLPIVARQELSEGPLLYGLLLAVFGIGAIVGAMAGGRLRGTYSAEWLVRIGALSLTGGLLLIGTTHIVPLTAIGAACCGFGWVIAHTSFNTAIQLSAPRWVSARALALYQTATFGAMVVGSWFFGWIAERTDVSTALLAASACQGVGALLSLRLKLPATESLNFDPLGRWQEPALDVPLGANSGPIVVEIEYCIAEESAEAFRTAMKERKRIRLRDGARDWVLRRDLQEPSRWIESYRVADWADYIRHNQRRTQEDAASFSASRRFHVAPDKPIVRRFVQINR